MAIASSSSACARNLTRSGNISRSGVNAPHAVYVYYYLVVARSWTNPTLSGIANEHPRLSLRARLAERGNPSGRVDCHSRLGSFAMTNCRCSLDVGVHAQLPSSRHPCRPDTRGKSHQIPTFLGQRNHLLLRPTGQYSGPNPHVSLQCAIRSTWPSARANRVGVLALIASGCPSEIQPTAGPTQFQHGPD